MMNKIFYVLAVVGLVLTFSGCQSADNSAEVVDVCKGYSITQVGLKFDSANEPVYIKESDKTSINNANGKVTEIYGKAIKEDVLLTALQSFYKKDLINGEVYINGKTYTREQLSNNLHFVEVYENDEVVVYDITGTNTVESLEQRMLSYGFSFEEVGEMLSRYNDTMVNLSEKISEKNVTQSPKIQEVNYDKTVFF